MHVRHAALALVASSLFVSQGAAQPVEVIYEDFEAGSIDGNLLGTSVIQDLGDGRTSTLRLTQGLNSQAGFAWFNEPFNLRDRKVTIDFDFWIRPGSSSPPADGMSVIFQFGNNTSATGGGGGGLGTCNFPTPYVSVAFDIWDNRETNDEIDPNDTPCYEPATTRTCHVEVNQNVPCPGTNYSTQTNVDFGVDAPDFTTIGATLTPIHATVVFDSGAIEVKLQTDGDPAFAEPVTVLRTALKSFPDPADAIIGFSASTGGANAHHEVDNVSVVTDNPTPRKQVKVLLGDGERGAINCGSTTEVTGSVGGQTYTFVRDIAFGTFLGTRTDVVPNEDLFADYGTTTGGNVAGPSDPPIAVENVSDPNLQNVYQTERWSNGAIAYRFGVNVGRFEVSLHFAENCPACGIGAAGAPTRIVNASVEGEEVLSHWSCAQAAGEEAGAPGPVAYRAVVRTYAVDVTDGYLDVLVSDLGLPGTPPENAQVNGVSYRRIGAATGAPIEGDIEDRLPLLPRIDEEVLVDANFDADPVGGCPEGWTCNGLAFTPQVADSSPVHGVAVNPRLRLTNVAGGVAATVLYNEPVILDLASQGFEAQFTVYLTQDVAVNAVPADGFTFFFLPADPATDLSGILGVGGGSLGLSGIGPAVGFEVDTYQGTNDPNGIVQNGSGHVGIIYNGDVTQHLQTDVTLNDAVYADVWPLRLDQDGQFLTGTSALEAEGKAGLRVRILLNGGRLQAWLATANDDPDLGLVFPETKVIDTEIGWIADYAGPGFFGFTAATGGAMSYHEVDDVRISVFLNKPVTVARRVPHPVFVDSTTPVAVELAYKVSPEAGSRDVSIVETLPAGFSARAVSAGGSFDPVQGRVTWNLAGVSADGSVSYEVVPDDATREDVVLRGTYSVAGGPALTIPPTVLLWVPPPFPRAAAEVLASDDFESYFEGDCPDGWTCNGVATFTPGVTLEAGHEGRLRLTQTSADIAATVIWNEEVDLSENSFVAGFDAYLSNSTGATPADGMTFLVLDASQSTLNSLGAGGGGLGYLGLNGFAVELDIWQGDSDPSGYNTPAVAYGHMAVIRDGIVATHVQTHVDLDPTRIPAALGGAGWPDFVDRVGSGYPLHVEVDYNNGRVQVYLEAPETGAEPAFPRTLVLDTVVKFPDSGGEDPVLQRAYLGFSAATGGANANHEVDEVEILLYPKSAGGVRFIRSDANADGATNITDGIYVLNYLFLGGPAPPCEDAADANGDDGINITDGIYILNYLFLGGPEPTPPFPDCGLDPGEDGVSCESFPPCR
ncbi:MAG: hypothetical protein ACUVYA_11170 [Planctomycetota bacterium]